MFLLHDEIEISLCIEMLYAILIILRQGGQVVVPDVDDWVLVTVLADPTVDDEQEQGWGAAKKIHYGFR